MAMDQYSSGTSRGGGTAGAVREDAANVGQRAAGAAGDVAQTTKEHGEEVVAEARRQARDLAQEARTGMREQATAQRDRAVGGLRALGDELEQMAERGGQSGAATEIARQVADRTRDVARFLESREPGDLVDEVRAYARRRPGTFILGAAVAGVLAGRMTKAVRDRGSSGSTERTPDYGQPGYAESASIPDGGQARFREPPGAVPAPDYVPSPAPGIDPAYSAEPPYEATGAYDPSAAAQPGEAWRDR
jgi:hypothetical protein